MFIALGLSGFFLHEARWIRWLSVLFLLAWAVPSIPTILSFRWMLNPEWGMVNALIFKWFGVEGPGWLTERHYGLGCGDRGAHLEVAAVLDADPARRAHGDPEGAVRVGRRRRRDHAGRRSAT